MSNPNQGPRPQVPAQKAAVPTPVAPAAVVSTKAPEEAPDVAATEVLLTQVVPEIPVDGGMAEDLEEFNRFRQLSREAKEAEFEAARAAKRDALLRGSAPVEAPVQRTPTKAGKAEAGEVTVFPLRTENRLRIGPRYYQFQARKPISVPADIIPHLVEKGIISPPAHLT